MSECWAGFDFWFDDIHELHRCQQVMVLRKAGVEMSSTCSVLELNTSLRIGHET
jgi:hypothetical protein